MGVWLQTEIQPVTGSASDAVRNWLRPDSAGGLTLARAGGSVWGLWDGRPGLGFRSDTLLLFTHWSDDAIAGAAVDLLKASTLIRGVTGTPLHPTVRPTSAERCTGNGIWVFREFEVDATEAEHFVALSAEAWSSFEAAFDARIHGLFRAPAPSEGRAAFLLVTRYADLATWEDSRSEQRDPQAWQRFRERHAITHWTRGRSAVRIDP